MEVLDLRVGQEGARILPGHLVSCPHTDGHVPFLEGVRGADDLLVEPLIEFPLDAGDVGEHILPGLHILYDVGSFRRSRLRRHPGKANDPQDDGGYGAQSNNVPSLHMDLLFSRMRRT